MIIASSVLCDWSNRLHFQLTIWRAVQWPCNSYWPMWARTTVQSLVMASVAICILNCFCTVTQLLSLSSLLDKQPNLPQSSLTANDHELHPHPWIGGQLTYQKICNKIYSTQTHKEANNTPHKTHTSTTLTSNIFPDQASITSCVQLCHNVLCWVTQMKVRTEIQHLTVIQSCDIYCTVWINSTTPKSN